MSKPEPEPEPEPDELPYKTAPELVPIVCDRLCLSDKSKDRAQHLAEIFGGLNPDHHIGRKPRTICGAVIWMTAKERPTQDQVGYAADVSSLSIRNAVSDIHEHVEEESQ